MAGMTAEYEYATAPRSPRPTMYREIMCRACAKWTTRGDDGIWRHTADGTDACVQPDDLRPATH